MSLTTAKESYIKKQKQKHDLEEQLKVLKTTNVDNR